MPLKKTACRRSARVVTRATAAVNNRTKASMSTASDQTSKSGESQSRKSAENGGGPRVTRRRPRRREESEGKEWNRKNVSSDEVVDDKANPVSSAQGRERQKSLRGRDETRDGDSLEYRPVPSRNASTRQDGENQHQPPDTPPAQTHARPPASSWRDCAAVAVDDCSATASTWREPRQPIASTWREAASFSQREVKPRRQPQATTGPEGCTVPPTQTSAGVQQQSAAR
jgi:hypothetical protein